MLECSGDFVLVWCERVIKICDDDVLVVTDVVRADRFCFAVESTMSKRQTDCKWFVPLFRRFLWIVVVQSIAPTAGPKYMTHSRTVFNSMLATNSDALLSVSAFILCFTQQKEKSNFAFLCSALETNSLALFVNVFLLFFFFSLCLCTRKAIYSLFLLINLIKKNNSLARLSWSIDRRIFLLLLLLPGFNHNHCRWPYLSQWSYWSG